MGSEMCIRDSEKDNPKPLLEELFPGLIDIGQGVEAICVDFATGPWLLITEIVAADRADCEQLLVDKFASRFFS